MEEHVLQTLSRQYPQLLLPLGYDTKDSPAYKEAVLRGGKAEGELNFSLSPKDTLTPFDTPAGQAMVLYLDRRDDFEHCVRALAYRCEPREIPASMGATTVRGLINWQKIHKHRAEYFASGHLDWKNEFKRFTAVKANYTDSIILISGGYYSAVTPSAAGQPEEIWKDLSVTIRTYHELTHFICRGLFPDDIDAVRDEIFADMIGITSAFGAYEPALARLFLGIEGESYRPGGRLQNYLSEDDPLEAAAQKAEDLIETLAGFEAPASGEDIFSYLLIIFEKIRKKV